MSKGSYLYFTLLYFISNSWLAKEIEAIGYLLLVESHYNEESKPSQTSPTGLVTYHSPLQLPDGAPPRGPMRQPGGGGAAGGAGGGPQQGRQGRGHAPGFSKQVTGQHSVCIYALYIIVSVCEIVIMSKLSAQTRGRWPASSARLAAPPRPPA